jgi:hypothetical protein
MSLELNSPDFIHIVCRINPARDNVNAFLSQLSETLHPDDLRTMQIPWEGLNFIVISIRRCHWHYLKELTLQLNLTIEDGIPNIVSTAGERWFPISGNNVYTVFSVSRRECIMVR